MKLSTLATVTVATIIGATGLFGGESAQASTLPAQGVYRWDAPSGPIAVDAYDKWLGNEVEYAEAFEATDSWDQIDGAGWQLEPWTTWLNAKPGRRLILGVPLLPGGWDGSGVNVGTGPLGPVSLEQGATGAYNAVFTRLAHELVNRGIADRVVLRLGWEFNGGWYAWRAGGKEAAFAEYWRQIVRSIRAVPGASGIKYSWNPTVAAEVNYSLAYPGDAYVDDIGIDIYDRTWATSTYENGLTGTAADTQLRRERAWTALSTGWYGIEYFRSFAAARNKPISFPEWGVWTAGNDRGGGDNPYFIQQMYNYMTNPANNVAYAVYFDVYAHDGDHQLSPGGGHVTAFPLAAAKFRELFGGVPATSTTTAAPTTTVAPPAPTVAPTTTTTVPPTTTTTTVRVTTTVAPTTTTKPPVMAAPTTTTTRPKKGKGHANR